MALDEELARLADLRRDGPLTSAEFALAKERLLGGGQTVDYAFLAYQAVTATRRRSARVAAAVAVLFAVMSLWGLARQADLRRQAAAVEDAALVEALGVRIPDPRPDIERLELRVRATAYGVVALVAALPAAAAALLWLLLRPPTPPSGPAPTAPPGSAGRSPPSGAPPPPGAPPPTTFEG